VVVLASDASGSGPGSVTGPGSSGTWYLVLVTQVAVAPVVTMIGRSGSSLVVAVVW
jgi:hypothetical protein